MMVTCVSKGYRWSLYSHWNCFVYVWVIVTLKIIILIIWSLVYWCHQPRLTHGSLWPYIYLYIAQTGLPIIQNPSPSPPTKSHSRIIGQLYYRFGSDLSTFHHIGRFWKSKMAFSDHVISTTITVITIVIMIGKPCFPLLWKPQSHPPPQVHFLWSFPPWVNNVYTPPFMWDKWSFLAMYISSWRTV